MYVPDVSLDGFFFLSFFPFTFTLPFYCIGMQMRIWRVIDNHSVCFD